MSAIFGHTVNFIKENGNGFWNNVLGMLPFSGNGGYGAAGLCAVVFGNEGGI